MDSGPVEPCEAAGEFLSQVRRRAVEARLPLSGSIELTRRCNLRCRHCYAGPLPPAAADARELPTDRLLALIDEIADAGCLFLLLTGGEPLLRPDFARVYTHAKRKGLLVTVFTNGTLIGDEIARLFRDWPPRRVEVSVYGATPRTGLAVTGAADAVERCCRGVERLLAHGVRVALKMPLLSLNIADLPAVERLADSYGLKLRIDPAISARLDGDRAPLSLRVNAAQAAAAEFSRAERREAWRQCAGRRRGDDGSDRLYRCAAGLILFNVTPDGWLQPCLFAPRPRYDLRGGSFREGWEVLAGLRDLKAPPDLPCLACEKRPVCGYCPGFFLLENEREDRYSPFLCELGEHRLIEMRRN